MKPKVPCPKCFLGQCTGDCEKPKGGSMWREAAEFFYWHDGFGVRYGIPYLPNYCEWLVPETPPKPIKPMPKDVEEAFNRFFGL